MVEPAQHRLSISTQCRLLRISRSSYYYTPVPETDETLALMTVIDATFMECPWYGSRQMARHLRRTGQEVGRRRARRLMAKMGLTPIYQRPRTSDPHPQHRVYPYLLRKLAIERPNHVWCADVTYIPMRRGFLYLVAIMALRRRSGGRPARCWPGGCRTRWTRASASQRWRRHWPGSADRKSSTRTRAVSLRRKPSPACCATPRSASAWTAGGGGWTMSS